MIRTPGRWAFLPFIVPGLLLMGRPWSVALGLSLLAWGVLWRRST
jgi:hypothetical protein